MVPTRKTDAARFTCERAALAGFASRFTIGLESAEASTLFNGWRGSAVLFFGAFVPDPVREYY